MAKLPEDCMTPKLAESPKDFARLEDLESAILETIDFLAAEQCVALNSSEFGSL
jgi:hypothetical protein